MKRNDIIRAFDEVKPTQDQKDRILENVLNSQNKSHFEWRSFVPAMAAALDVITVLAGFKALDTAGRLPVSLVGFADTAKSFFKGENGNHSSLVTTADPTTEKNSPTKANKKGDIAATDPTVQTPAADAETVANTFTVNYVTYKEVTEELAKKLPVDIAVKEEDVGKVVSTVAEKNKYFGGLDVHEYLPIKGRFFYVLEEKDGSYKLFMFDKTDRNDVKSYFDIFGITSAEDIAEITVTEGENTVEIEDVEAVFNELSKAESNIFEYEKAVKAYVKPVPAAEPETEIAKVEEETTAEPAEIAEDAEVSAEDKGAEVTETVLKTLTLKIKTVSGLVYETEFYPQIEYISTCKISDDFSELLKTVLSK